MNSKKLIQRQFKRVLIQYITINMSIENIYYIIVIRNFSKLKINHDCSQEFFENLNEKIKYKCKYTFYYETLGLKCCNKWQNIFLFLVYHFKIYQSDQKTFR